MKKRNADLVCDVAELLSVAGEGRSGSLNGVVRSVARHMGADACSVYAYDESAGELRLYATEGLDPQAVGRVRMKLGEGITGRALKELRPICVACASASDDYRHFPGIGEERYEGFLAVPILRGLRRIGALVVESKRPDRFSPEDVKVLRGIAAQLASMIENARLLDEARDRETDEEEALPDEPAGKAAPGSLLRGRPASPGTARGRALALAAAHGDVCPLPDPDKPAPTLEDFERAVEKTADQIARLQRRTGEDLADVAVLIFNAHLLILEDEQFVGRMAEAIRNGTPPLKAVSAVVDEYVDVFSRSRMPLVREKVLDVKDLGNRLIRNLIGGEEGSADYRGRIVIAHELLPSDLLKLGAENVEGFVVSSGVTSHNAIICRSLGIPMVALDRAAADTIEEGAELLMDADQGILYVAPGEEILARYRELEAARRALSNADEIPDETRTRCGERVRVFANVNLLSDLKMALEFKAEGVGLYRSEFPFIVRSDFPDEEEQFVIYRRLFERMGDREVTLRTLDIGGDKMLSYYSHVNEANPFLGMRAIRFSLQNKDIFATQLRAFLRAGVDSDMRIMFPLVSSVDDFDSARCIVEECKERLEREGIAHHRSPKLGVMMELPSAVEVAEELAEEADFLSIGSNDLIQYMLAVDRTNEQVSGLYLAHHPAILRAIRRIVDAARRNGKDVSICGDLSSDARMLPFLLGVGLRKFSIDMANAPVVQRLVAGIDLAEAKVMAERMLEMGRISQIEAFLAEYGSVPSDVAV